jgi:multiple sugar transport system permease protein
MTVGALTDEAERAVSASRGGRAARGAYLAAAACVAVIAIMAAPMALSFLASIKTAADASAVPPHYLPRALSFENYAKVINFQAGLASYVGNSGLVALMTLA